MPTTAPGRLITLEGGEGAGKSTQAGLLAERLSALGLPVLRSREPGGAPGAERVRHLLLAEAPLGGWDGLTEALLHAAARREHVVRTIRPALLAGTWVVCDRFADSTLAYQGAGLGVSRATLDALLAPVLEGLRPDLTLVLDVDPAIGLQRAARRGAADRYEAADAAFHARIRAAFRAIAAAEPERCVVVDAGPEPAAVAQSVLEAVHARFPELRAPA